MHKVYKIKNVIIVPQVIREQYIDGHNKVKAKY